MNEIHTRPAAEVALPEKKLLNDFLRLYPYQPATAYFRWFETAAVLEDELPQGFGLDVGCGDGQLTSLMADRVGGWRLVGIDPDPDEIALAEGNPLYERLHCCGGDAVPEPDASFEFAISNSVLEHIPDVRPVLRETHRLLKPGATFLITVPSGEFRDCLHGPPWWWRLMWGGKRDVYLDEFDQRIAHHYYWTDEEWSRELREAGFQGVDFKSCLPSGLIRRWESLANCTSGVLFKMNKGKMRPIEIQRKMGMRKKGQQMPGLLSSMVSVYLRTWNSFSPGNPPRYGVRIIRATA